jgi:hypothetical protein
LKAKLLVFICFQKFDLGSNWRSSEIFILSEMASGAVCAPKNNDKNYFFSNQPALIETEMQKVEIIPLRNYSCRFPLCLILLQDGVEDVWFVARRLACFNLFIRILFQLNNVLIEMFK